MAEPRIAIAILAAGNSRRFGAEDKLRIPFRSRALGLHASDALRTIVAESRVIISNNRSHVCARGWEASGFAVVENPNANEGMGTSVAVAARIARRSGADALMIALADMPLVPRSHFQSLVDASHTECTGAIVASGDGKMRSPPAIFGRAHFDALAQLSGNVGARALLQDAQIVVCPPEWLVDIDTPEALAALEQLKP